MFSGVVSVVGGGLILAVVNRNARIRMGRGVRVGLDRRLARGCIRSLWRLIRG